MSYPSPPGPPEPGQPGNSPQPGYPTPQPGYSPPQPGYSPPQPGYSPPQDAGPPAYSAQPGYSPQPGYPPPGYSPQPAYSAPPPKTSTGAAKVLTFTGIAGLILGAVGVVVGILFMVQPIKAITDGSGDGVIGRVGSGETITVDLSANKSYAVWIVSSTDGGTYSGDPIVTDPDGDQISVSSTTSSRSGSAGGTSATSGWTFTSKAAGTYEISAPHLSSGDLVLTSEDLIIKVGIGAIMLIIGIGIGVVGFGLTLGGAIWWGSRKKKARALAGPSYT